MLGLRRPGNVPEMGVLRVGGILCLLLLPGLEVVIVPKAASVAFSVKERDSGSETGGGVGSVPAVVADAIMIILCV